MLCVLPHLHDFIGIGLLSGILSSRHCHIQTTRGVRVGEERQHPRPNQKKTWDFPFLSLLFFLLNLIYSDLEGLCKYNFGASDICTWNSWTTAFLPVLRIVDSSLKAQM